MFDYVSCETGEVLERDEALKLFRSGVEIAVYEWDRLMGQWFLAGYLE